jgi:hypothetical protein
MLLIFDLDGTAIDSTHRQNTLADGSLNLAKWKENNTPEKIALDTLLPLGEQWAGGLNKKIAIITARVLGDADYKFLKDNNLRYDYIYSRKVSDIMPDAALKRLALYKLAKDMGKSLQWLRNFAVMYDDNLSVLRMASKLKLLNVDATLYNQSQLLKKAQA